MQLICPCPANRIKGSAPGSRGYEDGNGATALHAAVENGHIAAVQLLLLHNARQLKSMMGSSPLFTAAEYERPAEAAALLTAGTHANIDPL